ncbi:hypothetical protein ACFTZB_35970 [Rhodococcus sp. NPDC057014]|uniref:hypothetical protein n=1 Tax=Rhodococcus sp. NPDC057014 TaxID=3346000 RepID=UPI00363D1957
MSWNQPTITGWTARIDGDLSSVALIDPSHLTRATLRPGPGDEFTAHFSRLARESLAERIDRYGAALRKGVPASLELADGTTGAVTDQLAGRMRRKYKRAEVALSGRAYTLRHTSGRKATAERDGAPLAELVRGRGLRSISVTRTTHAHTDHLDEVILTLFEKVIVPGRSGAIDEFVSSLSGV